MSTTATRTDTRRATLNLRIRPEERDLIDQAARLRGKNRTDFVLEAARQAAEEALLDQTLIRLAPEAYAEFIARLDMPPQPLRTLIRFSRGERGIRPFSSEHA